MRERTNLAAKKAVKDEEKQRNKQLIKEGKKPVFASKAEQRNKELVSKYEELKKKGSLEKYIKKKNKQKASKGKKLIQE
jgi:ribosomal RNA-processing protein 36